MEYWINEKNNNSNNYCFYGKGNAAAREFTLKERKAP